jgi:N-sulfoglucosamine sulfohydrolase
LLCIVTQWASGQEQSRPPNILMVIADDWSFPHAGAYGDGSLSTPAFDRVARDGALFTRAFTAAPSCTPSRAAILTGRGSADRVALPEGIADPSAA